MYAIGYRKFGKLFYLHEGSVLPSNNSVDSGFRYSFKWKTSSPGEEAQFKTIEEIQQIDVDIEQQKKQLTR